jgi:VanZ family protein
MRATFHGLRIAIIALLGYWSLLFISTHIPTNLMAQWRLSDKLLHCVAFSGLSLLIAWAIPTVRAKPAQNIFLAAVASVAYAGFDELSQIPVGRHADWYDFYADCLGIVIGLSFYTAIRTYLHSSGIELLQDDRKVSR